ncbi:MAG TPA: hypothetical protein VFM05_03520, partial [Candidatus Saccharimonadales bacterium]|nr:hypothetical protein [Candidatus Saccharimonadales bacterium]
IFYHRTRVLSWRKNDQEITKPYYPSRDYHGAVSPYPDGVLLQNVRLDGKLPPAYLRPDAHLYISGVIRLKFLAGGHVAGCCTSGAAMIYAARGFLLGLLMSVLVFLAERTTGHINWPLVLCFPLCWFIAGAYFWKYDLGGYRSDREHRK